MVFSNTQYIRDEMTGSLKRMNEHIMDSLRKDMINAMYSTILWNLADGGTQPDAVSEFKTVLEIPRINTKE